MQLKHLAVALMLAFTGTSAGAQDETSFIITTLTDGKPWQTQGPNGRNVSVRFMPDGTGKVGQGLLRRSFTWQMQGSELCLEGLPGDASGCFTLSVVDGVIVGAKAGRAFLTFRR